MGPYLTPYVICAQPKTASYTRSRPLLLLFLLPVIPLFPLFFPLALSQPLISRLRQQLPIASILTYNTRLTSAMAELPSNVHVSQHPSLLAKLSQLRSKTASPRDVKSLVHEIALILSCEAVSSAIKPASGPKVAQVSSTVSSCTLTQSRT